MPIREFKCPKCEQEFELFQSMHAKVKAKCPDCKVWAESLISGGCHAYVENVTTLGQFAERQSKKMGAELVAKKEAEYGITRKPEDEETRRLMEATPTELKKYIHEGKLPPKKSRLTKKEIQEQVKEQKKIK